jgi:hypothetical protein
MLRILGFVVVLTLTGTMANVSAAEPQKPVSTKACTQEEFYANCHKQNARFCDWWWDKQRRMGGSCMR